MPNKPTEQEEEYFARLDFEKKKRAEAKNHAKMVEEEKSKLKELHYMHCPKCGMNLITINYKGIAVDSCSGCEGIWLDAGELEAITRLERSGFDKLFSLFKR